PYHFNLMNPVSFELKALDEIFEMLQKVFISVGVVFVVFASLLFSNFIATSISYKKREIGILRAIGSRSNDVFRIFFAESFLIAMINFVLSLGGTFAICGLINHLVRTEAGLLLTVLTVGLRQAGLLFGICLLVAAAASFLPVRRIAAKRPIDAIRDR
ncbi:MAG: FtsX-like permease family protein, partial [Firmicutes bacterium]|nr:FtsX-like permease family protein [Bacillota bacterium]